ncbi:beta-lactamase/transpeptidase-like protein [Entophlyctis helioformis]|nr:beta-lactamase/transpeptidase-like protein [Entophlyctis helioformis]
MQTSGMVAAGRRHPTPRSRDAGPRHLTRQQDLRPPVVGRSACMRANCVTVGLLWCRLGTAQRGCATYATSCAPTKPLPHRLCTSAHRVQTDMTVETFTEADTLAIRAVEQAILDYAGFKEADRLAAESNDAFVARALLSKGCAALTVAVSREGAVPAWAKAYGTRRNGAAIEPVKARDEAAAAASKTDDAAAKTDEAAPTVQATECVQADDNDDIEPDEKQDDDGMAGWEEWLRSTGKKAIDDADASDADIGLIDAPVSPATVFQAASISKPLTAVVVMRLVQQGLLDLDADIDSYLCKDGSADGWRLQSGLPESMAPAAPTTLRQLLAHAAGTNVHGFGGYNRKAVRNGTLAMPASTVDVLNGTGNSDRVEIKLLPGLASRYSGGGTTIVQHVLEQVTGKPFAHIMDEHLIQPLGLLNTSFHLAMDTPPNNGDYAAGHLTNDGIPVPGGYYLHPEAAAAGCWTTPTDLNKVHAAMYASVHGDNDGFLRKDLAQEMLKPHFLGDDEGNFGIGWGQDKETFGHDIAIRMASGTKQDKAVLEPFSIADCVGTFVVSNAERMASNPVQPIVVAMGTDKATLNANGDAGLLVTLPGVTMAAPVAAIRTARKDGKARKSKAHSMVFDVSPRIALVFKRGADGLMSVSVSDTPLQFVAKQ